MQKQSGRSSYEGGRGPAHRVQILSIDNREPLEVFDQGSEESLLQWCYPGWVERERPAAQAGGNQVLNQSSGGGSREGETDARDIGKEEMTDFGD